MIPVVVFHRILERIQLWLVQRHRAKGFCWRCVEELDVKPRKLQLGSQQSFAQCLMVVSNSRRTLGGGGGRERERAREREREKKKQQGGTVRCCERAPSELAACLLTADIFLVVHPIRVNEEKRETFIISLCLQVNNPLLHLSTSSSNTPT